MFKEAKKIWINNKEKEVNLFAGFVCNFKFDEERNRRVCLRLTGQTTYSVYLNGVFVHSGPARAGKGYTRVDELVLTDWLANGKNNLYIEVAGYNCNTLSVVGSASFLQAELVCDDEIVAYTVSDDVDNAIYNGSSEFLGYELKSKEQKVIRYSFQRPFSEVYHLDNNGSDVTNQFGRKLETAKLTAVDIDIKYLERGVSYCEYDYVSVDSLVEKGRLSEKNPDSLPEFNEVRNFNAGRDSEFVEFSPEEYESHAMLDYLKFDFVPVRKLIHKHTALVDDGSGFNDIDINTYEYRLFKLPVNSVGFISMEVIADEDSDVYVMFDEKLLDNFVRIENLGMTNIVKLSLAKSEMPYHFQTFEPYGMKYITVFVTKGNVSINSLGVIEVANPEADSISFECSDAKLKAVFEAARQTYRTNAVDVFMDCPTRERAGWLCDSTFTAQAAQYFSGNTKVEKNFLENFIYCERDEHLPEHMLAMSYPGIHTDGNFIPQWAMWYIIELKGYLKRDLNSDVNLYKDLCYGLLEWFAPYKNSDGLLENLPAWNFIEWSKANEWVKDVNYPTNMLYSKMLRIIGELYGDRSLIDESRKVKDVIIEQSFNGEFFIDNAVRDDNGKLCVTDNVSEVCQYYAMYFDIAHKGDPRFNKLVDVICNVFGPEREQHGVMPEVAYANAFPGFQLRLSILMKWKMYTLALESIKGYFYPMAELTGTLWENKKIEGSLNHGFASFVGVAIVMCLTGLNEINEKYHFVSADTSDVKDIAYDISIMIRDGEVKCYKKKGYHGYIDIPESYLLIADR